MRLIPALLVCLFAAREAAAGELERWLPRGTHVCISLNDVVRSRARLGQGRWRHMRGEPAAQRLLYAFEVLLNRARSEYALSGRAWPGTVWRLAKRQVVFAVLPGSRPALLLDGGDAYERHLEALRASGVIGRRSVYRHRGVRLVAHANSGGEGPGGTLWHFRRGDDIAVAWERGVLEELLARSGPRFAQRPDPDADAWAFLDESALGELEGTYAELLRLLGGRGALTATLRLHEDGIAMRAFLRVPGKKRGVLRLLETDNAALTPPPFLPSDTTRYSAMRLDVRRFARELREVAEEFAPDLAKRIPRDPEAMLRGGAAEFFRLLGDEFASAQVGGRALEMARVRSPAKAQRVLGPNAVVDGWLVTPRLRSAGGLATAPVYRNATARLPARGFAIWYERIRPRASGSMKWNHWSALVETQAGMLVNDPRGLRLEHFVRLRRR